MNRALQQQLSHQTNQGLIDIRQAEINYYLNLHTSFGTQAALVGGFTYGTFTQNTIDEGNRFHQIYTDVYFVLAALTIASAIHVVLCTMLLQVMGPGLALQGPVGSMARAAEGMKQELKPVLLSFTAMIIIFSLSTIAAFWQIMDTHVATCATGCFVFVARFWYVYCERIYLRFYWDEFDDGWNERDSSTVDDIEQGGVTTNPMTHAQNNKPPNIGGNSTSGGSVTTSEGKKKKKKGIVSFLFTPSPQRREADFDGAQSQADGRMSQTMSHSGISNTSATSSGGNNNMIHSALVSSLKDGTTHPNVTMEGYMTMCTYTGRKRDVLKDDWERRYFTLNVSGHMFCYKSRQKYRSNAKAPLFTRPLVLADYEVKVENLDYETRLDAAMEVGAAVDDSKTVFSDDSAPSAYSATIQKETKKIKPYRFQITLTYREDQDHLDWILRCDTEEELMLWSGAMRDISPSSFTDA